MLELALLLPIYMLIFFIVWTTGDIGLISTQSHLGARYAAWRREPDSGGTVMNAVAGGAIRARALTGTRGALPGYGRKPGEGYIPVSLRYWSQSSNKDAFSFRTYNLEAPLAWKGRTAAQGSISIKEKDVEDVIKEHSSHFIAPSAVSSKFPVDVGNAKNFKYSEKMLAAAMEGDYGYGEKMPWLQRQVAMTALTMRGAAGITSRYLYRSTHTVLLGSRYFTMVPGYYEKIGTGEQLRSVNQDYLRDHYDVVAPVGRAKAQRNMLRNPAALRNELGNRDSVTEDGKLHQLHFIHARKDLNPPF